MPHPTRQAIVRWAACVLLTLVVLVAYPLSYAPMMMWCKYDPPNIYEPVDRIIDNTPLRRPLFAWAHIWGVGWTFEFQAAIRDSNRKLGL